MKNKMKHIATAAALGVVALLASCVSRQVAVEAESRSDSLELVVSAKDSLINAVFADINAISENLALIKSRENLITVAGESEGGRRPVEEIDNDIKAIDRLLRENRAKIESLQRRRPSCARPICVSTVWRRMIADMNRQLAEKKAEVEQLRESLVRMGDEVKSLTEEVAVRSAEVENLSGEKVELQNQLNTVYYIVGAEKELRDAQIINKQGFIGRTLTVGRNSNFDSFTMTDSRLLSEVPVGQKKATLVTSHPEGSYELVTDANKVVEKLIITDPVRFWESSKILIISCK